MTRSFGSTTVQRTAARNLTRVLVQYAYLQPITNIEHHWSLHVQFVAKIDQSKVLLGESAGVLDLGLHMIHATVHQRLDIDVFLGGAIHDQKGLVLHGKTGPQVPITFLPITAKHSNEAECMIARAWLCGSPCSNAHFHFGNRGYK